MKSTSRLSSASFWMMLGLGLPRNLLARGKGEINDKAKLSRALARNELESIPSELYYQLLSDWLRYPHRTQQIS